jgi:hypothetical protein
MPGCHSCSSSSESTSRRKVSGIAKRVIAAGVVLLGMGALLVAQSGKKTDSGSKMIDAAKAFQSTLSKAELKKASFSYDDEERLNWHFIPRVRKGLPLKELEGAPLKAAQRLIASGLSEVGYDQAINVMSLEELLFLLEGGDRATRRDKRDPLKYYISLFGTPGSSGTWGWRVEGHHLSLNYSITDGELVASTPEFFGANPGTVEAGPGRRIRVLGTEEDLARQILKSCTPAQQKVAWLDKEAPDDLRGGGVAQPETTAPVGLKYADMSADQKKLMNELLTEYLQNMPADVERLRRAKINKAGLKNVHFAWWGSENLNERHYYRVQGSTFIIEYNNTQNSANHVHSIWRDMAGDFNVSLKK